MYGGKREINDLVHLLQLKAEELGEHLLIEESNRRVLFSHSYITPEPGDLWPIGLLNYD